MGAGIDYSGGTANFDKNTGIRFGVINLNRLPGYAIEDFEHDYGEATCPDCDCKVVDSSETEDILDEWDEENDGPTPTIDKDYFCNDCDKCWWSEDCFPDEPVSTYHKSEEYILSLDSYNDIFVLKSPYYTTAQFCSPCARGAGHLENYCEDGVKTYCLGAEWFDAENPCPYPIYSVATGKLVT